jgi:hypothetical protein
MALKSIKEAAERPFKSHSASATLEDLAVAKQKRIAPKRVTSGTPAPAARTLVVTDENVEELKEKFDTLPENDPEYDRLGDALHRYMIG